MYTQVFQVVSFRYDFWLELYADFFSAGYMGRKILSQFNPLKLFGD